GLHGASNEGSFNRQFAVAAVDENAELYAARTSVVKKCVHGGTDCASGVKHVVQEDHVFINNIGSQRRGFFYDGVDADCGEIVAIERDIQGAYRHRSFLNLLNQSGQAAGQRNATTLDANQHQIFHAVIFFDDLVGQAN